MIGVLELKKKPNQRNQRYFQARFNTLINFIHKY